MPQSRARLAATLTVIVAAGACLRLWRLDPPPIWLDETTTALVAAGRGPEAFPVGQIVSLAKIDAIFDPSVTATLGDAYGVLADPRVQELHPPVFYLLSNAALRAGLARGWPLVTRVRLLAALFGIVAVAAIYWAARQGLETATALLAAAIAATSPFAVSVSREARNYSYAMLLAAISLGASFAILQALDRDRRARATYWALWVGAAILGIYAHYFVLFTIVAEAALIGSVAIRRRSREAASFLILASAAVAAAFLPWVPVLYAQTGSGEQSWLLFGVHGSPIELPYQLASAWQTMAMGKAWDVEGSLHGLSRFVQLVFFLWMMIAVARAIWKASGASAEDRTMRRTALLIAIVLLEFSVAMAALRKNFLGDVRYQVAYYPLVAVLLAAAFAPRRRPVAAAGVIAFALLNSVLVDYDIESWKGVEPGPVVERLHGGRPPALVIAGVGNYNEMIAECVFFKALTRAHGTDGPDVALVDRREASASAVHLDPTPFWNGVESLRPDVAPATVFLHNPGMLADEYRPSFSFATRAGRPIACRGVGLEETAREPDRILPRPAFRTYHCQ